MSEVNLASLAETGPNSADSTSNSTVYDVKLALKECGFGLFHVRLMLAAFFGLIVGVFIGCSASYVLPEAECDLQMNMLEKGILNAMVFLGMLTSSIVAGFMTDALGRKKFLVLGYGGTFVFMLVSGLAQNYMVLVMGQFFEGACFAAAYSSMLALTSEFCHDGIRDRIMLVASSSIPLGQVILAFLSWGILQQNWEDSYFDGRFVLHTWNFYFMILSAAAAMACVLYMLLPESPMYYISQHNYDKAREILINVYKENTRKPADTFKYKDLWKDRPVNEKLEPATLKEQVAGGFVNIKPMFRRPLLWYLIVFCILNFISMKIYTVLRMWFPQLSAIVEHYSTNTSDLCTMLDAYTQDLKTLPEVEGQNCVEARSGTETYINSVILGTICVIPTLISGILVNRVGKRNLYIVCSIITTALTLALRWTNSKISMVSLFSLDVAIATLMASLTQTMVLEYFPTTTRSLAMALVMTVGRTGSVVGNILFPILLDMGCAVPFFSLAAIVAATTVLAFFISPKKE